MKRQVLTSAFLLLLYMQAKGQTSVYYALPDSDAYWNEVYGGFDGSMFGATIISTFINGDTTIGETIYHKCYENGYYTDEDYDTIYYNNFYRFALRQDTSQKKVFIFGYPSFPFWSDSIESLLYDFNLSLGDTLPASVISPINSPWVTGVDSINSNYVSKVDSIFVGSGFRKRFWISGIPSTSKDTNYFSIIEGIGSDQGLTDVPLTSQTEYYAIGRYSQLICFNQDGQTLWVDTAITNLCTFQTAVGINELTSENFITLYPNPATNQLTIQTSSLRSNEVVIVSIINVLGEIIYAEQYNGTQETINCKSFPAGIYFVQLTTAGDRWVGRFVKE